MASTTQDQAAAGPTPAATLSKAAVRAATALRISQATLADVLGLSTSSCYRDSSRALTNLSNREARNGSWRYCWCVCSVHSMPSWVQERKLKHG